MTTAETARALAAHERFRPHVTPAPPPDALPDLTDPATAGVLVAMLAEAGEPFGIDHLDGTYCVDTFGHGPFTSEHLGVAVAKALLAAWEK